MLDVLKFVHNFVFDMFILRTSERSRATTVAPVTPDTSTTALLCVSVRIRFEVKLSRIFSLFLTLYDLLGLGGSLSDLFEL